MPQTIRIRRGTKSQLVSYGTLALGELGLCSDSGEVFAGNGTSNILVGRALSGTLADRPNATVAGRFYYVTSGDKAGYLYFDDGSSWRGVNAQSLTDLSGTIDNIQDGTAFKKVCAGDITAGHVNKLSDGVNTKTAAEVKSHIDNVAVHRTINDSGTGVADLWSAQKIRNEIFNAIKGMDWQDSVKSRSVTAPPATPVAGDRYLVPSGATGAWTGKNGQIAHWSGKAWDFIIPSTGYAVYVEAENKNYTYNSAGTWVVTGGANQVVVAGNGLTGGGSGDTVSLAVGAGNGIEAAADGISVKAYNGISVNSSGVAANIDNDSIKYDSANGNRLMVANIDGGTF